MADASRPTKENVIVGRILADLGDRRGFRQEWDAIEQNIRDEIAETWCDIVRNELARLAPEPGGSADEPRADLMDRSLRKYAHDMRIAACGAWSSAAKPPIDLDEAACQEAAAHEERLRYAIDELADLSKPSEPAGECKDCDKLMTERDDAIEQADKLAACIEGLLGIEIGEHSSGNCPWQNAIDAADYELDKRARTAPTKVEKS